MGRFAVHSKDRLTGGLAAFWGALLLIDGVMRILPPAMVGALHGLGGDILPHAVQIFHGLNWPLAKIGMMEPFVGAWEVAIAMFLLVALYEMVTGDSDDLLPGSAMLILGLAMALTSLAIIFVAAGLARHGMAVFAALWPEALVLAFSLFAAVAERLDAEKALDWDPRLGESVPFYPFARR
ncbi:MAG: hypothetical protein J0H01_20065 [Rhizobiales bacterium]|nr:hypothetical protein [Hyphomicrobiales bacterium]